MGIVCAEIMEHLEKLAPLHLAEEWDNPGLILGSRRQEINRVLVCLDVTPAVIDNAVEKGADLIVSHHPFLFKGLKKINEDDVKGYGIYKLIRNNIGVYSAHTNLDAAEQGLNYHLAGLLGLKEIGNLKDYKTDKNYKLIVYVPEDSIETVREAISKAGAGWIGNYSHCTFMTGGTGTFKPLEGSKPYIGTAGNLERVTEYRLETIVPKEKLKAVVDAMLSAHPYEEVAYDLFTLEQGGKGYSFGKTGILEEPLDLNQFIALTKKALNISNLRIIGKDRRTVRRVAVFSGSFDGDLDVLKKKDIDVLVTGDVKHHTALDALDEGLCIIDAGHFGTERIIVPKLAEMLKSRFGILDIWGNNVEKDPFEYC